MLSVSRSLLPRRLFFYWSACRLSCACPHFLWRLILWAALLFSIASPASALKLRYSMKRGDVTRIKTGIAAAAIMQLPMMEDPMRMQVRGLAFVRQEVKDVSTEGVMEVWSEVTSGVMNFLVDGDQEKVRLPREVTVVRITPRGKVVSFSKETGEETNDETEMLKGTLGLDSEQMLGEIPGLIFPEGNVEVGSKWEEAYSVEIGNGKGLNIHCSALLTEMVELLGYQCAKIRTVVSVPIDGGAFGGDELPMSGMELDARGYAKGDLTYYFAHEEGFVVCTVGSISVFNHATLRLPTEAEELGIGGHDMNATTRMKMNMKSHVQKQSREGG
ncbi:MAG: hypothetical protein AUJ92_02205 [Armatimonadetes bacterium CG2_30_59_28]|nr:hypothetical protein [Armatimonadota bacterium]OIO98062.1 MAG: hypothetical protein AUJ92_02205 [Armatimonadetes bacterium CG2_30_59_28]PIU67368.1 MAG: hypothetical protein COS85_00900 [Armatimonadetes bacterium CG07_land_8_20_14_0_80_59_28]PIX40607.1 MAG: hypothetical protein COZ56_14345 [Armatimonadetes bacterium CG_4_8_14_3_um_filter_58_9]PIY41881.1 MAG: hypothetical protein COZ05_15010 [Armatimonadetes bacterium CG_4_10_14_3_um_filter_59_10]PJB73788.1 MAG: hypothetical protein CO095_054